MPDDAPRAADGVPEQHGPSHPLCRHHQPWSRQAMTRAPEVPPTSVRALDAVEAEARLEELSDILVDAVAHGASVNFMAGFSPDEARGFWPSPFPGIAEGAQIGRASGRERRRKLG